jgi:pimeloyl-ACP methyl ester carboxylesterase
MASFFLIHGGLHGAWCWSELVAALGARGHAAVATDQPGMGEDRTPPAEVTWESAVAKLVADFDALTEPAVVVGHSAGSTLAAQLAQERPQRVAAIVDVAGTVPLDGESCVDVLMHQANPVNELVSEAVEQDGTMIVRPLEHLPKVLYNDCSQEVVAAALSHLHPQPMCLFTGQVSITPEREGTVPRAFVECLRDVGITPGFQRWMIARRPGTRVLTLDSGHCPMLSQPAALADALGEAAAQLAPA